MKLQGSRLPTSLIASLLIMAGIFGGCTLLHWWSHPGYVPLSFDREKWASADAQHRGYMAESLLANQQLVGMTREQITNLLGEPDMTKDISIFRYHLGHMGRNPRAPYQLELYLFISFGADGKAKSAGIAD